jgi:hypothetical protein
MLSHAVLSVVQVFHIYDVEYGLCLSVRIWPFEDRSCGLRNGWNGGDG